MLIICSRQAQGSSRSVEIVFGSFQDLRSALELSRFPLQLFSGGSKFARTFLKRQCSSTQKQMKPLLVLCPVLRDKSLSPRCKQCSAQV